jgi:DNA gyrase subunit A
MGRATQGVRLITLKGDDEIASVAKIEHDEEEELDEAVAEANDAETAADADGDTETKGDAPSTDD